MKNTAAGFTLIELIVVITIIAIGASITMLALPNSAQQSVSKDAQRLAALLESARAQSRAAGVPITWQISNNGFEFKGQPRAANRLPNNWLDNNTFSEMQDKIILGPDPVIGAQNIIIKNGKASARIYTNGIMPFSIETQTEP